MEPFLRQRINCRIHRTIHEVYIKIQISRKVILAVLALSASNIHAQRKLKKVPFLQTIHWLFFLHVRTDHDGGKQFIRRIRCKTFCGIWKWWSENHTVIDLFKTKIFYGYLNRHIFMWNTEKGTTVTASRRIDKCPTPGYRFSDKFPTKRTDKMTNAREGMGTLGINQGIDWAIKFSHVVGMASRNIVIKNNTRCFKSALL